MTKSRTRTRKAPGPSRPEFKHLFRLQAKSEDVQRDLQRMHEALENAKREEERRKKLKTAEDESFWSSKVRTVDSVELEEHQTPRLTVASEAERE